jgi:GTPase SAR1 family protein
MARNPEEAMHLGASGTDKVRNVVLVGHGGAGKTSLAEAMLYLSGTTKRLGTVDDGHSGLDYDPEEVKRQFSINLSLAPVVHDGVKINIIDTPGFHRRRDRRNGSRRNGPVRGRCRLRTSGPDGTPLEDRR